MLVSTGASWGKLVTVRLSAVGYPPGAAHSRNIIKLLRAVVEMQKQEWLLE
jgi:hypothetical protein